MLKMRYLVQLHSTPIEWRSTRLHKHAEPGKPSHLAPAGNKKLKKTSSALASDARHLL
jgi:hypothetical protein